jgi:carbon storage regulator
MLVPTRRVGEEIVIAGDIRVTVLGVTGNRVRLGITVPYSVGPNDPQPSLPEEPLFLE